MSRVYEQTVQYLSEFIKKCYEADNSDLGDELDSEKNSYLAACRYYQSQQVHKLSLLSSQFFSGVRDRKAERSRSADS